ncbi:MAG: D-TA family PLP-dependent enzyme [Tannerellaceae bacterium]|nr:D-TA family PLP-dependent enzyme [Tannerellaceae bacterium]
MVTYAWYEAGNIARIDTPALLVYPDRIERNIQAAIRMAGGTNRLRPHVKTNKMAEVCSRMLRAGITRFKCATIAEAEMLAMLQAPDVLLAYQPVSPRIDRLIALVTTYPDTRFSCLLDNKLSAYCLDEACNEKQLTLDVYIDLNVGMDRTGVAPGQATDLAVSINSLPNLNLVGLHGYDGHIHDPEPEVRAKAAGTTYAIAKKVADEISGKIDYPLLLILGGSTTFPEHIKRDDCQGSPGTFVFWDEGYRRMLPGQPFEFAALVATRVISVIDDTHVCIDLGYKAVGAESPLPRVYFLNASEAQPVAHSEEHMVLTVPNSKEYPIGKVLYGVPHHICPTVALYDTAYVVENKQVTSQWKVTARNRCITI